jgi:HPt (histidine-containing phosphotransfer) domain-containing protein
VEIRSAIRQQDAARLKLTAHAFKGAVGNFAAAAAVASALRLEKMGRAGDLTGAGEAFAELEAEVQQLLPGLALLAQPE